MGVEIFPVALLYPDKWDEVVLYLGAMPIPARRKKELIVEWTKAVGAVLTREMVEAVLGREAERF